MISNRVIAEYEDGTLQREFMYGNGYNEVLAMFLPEYEGNPAHWNAFMEFIDAWLCQDPNACYDATYDHNSDGKINLTDIAYFAGVWDMPPMDESHFYYLHDALGSVRGLIGGIHNREEDREFYNYDVYGRSSDASTAGNPYRFAGYRYDAEISLYHTDNRPFDAETGRWLSFDPFGVNPAGFNQNTFDTRKQYSDGMNLYEYVRSNPSMQVDPLGLFFMVPPAGAYGTSSSNNTTQKTYFWICRRQMQCFPYLSNHDYISYGENPWGADEGKRGWGFTDNRTSKENSFNPDRCRACSISKTGTLQYGSGGRKTCGTATKEDVISCIENCPPRKKYGAFTYNCVDYAKEAVGKYCLNCNSQWTTKK